MEAEFLVRITMKGSEADIEKIRAALGENGEFHDITDGTGGGTECPETGGVIWIEDLDHCNLSADPSAMEFNPDSGEAQLEAQYLYEGYNGEAQDKSPVRAVFEAVNKRFAPVFEAFSKVSFFVTVRIDVEEIYEHGAGFACSYSIIEKGAEQKHQFWSWSTPTYADDDWGRYGEECDHYIGVMDSRLEWMQKLCAFWLAESTDAKTALEEAEKAAVAADVRYTADYEEEDEDDSPADIMRKRISDCHHDRVTENNWTLDLSGLGLTDSDFLDDDRKNGTVNLSPYKKGIDNELTESVKKLILSGNPITKVPDAVKLSGGLKKDLMSLTQSLEELHLAGTNIIVLPGWLAGFEKLREIDVAETSITELPQALAEKVKAGTLTVFGLAKPKAEKTAEEWRRAGVEYRRHGDLDEALKAHTKAIELDPAFARAYSNRAYVYEQMEQIDKAIEGYTKAIELSPTGQLPGEGDYYFNRGLTYASKLCRNTELAIADFKKALELNPDHTSAQAELKELRVSARRAAASARRAAAKLKAPPSNTAKENMLEKFNLDEMDEDEREKIIGDIEKVYAMDEDEFREKIRWAKDYEQELLYDKVMGHEVPAALVEKAHKLYAEKLRLTKEEVDCLEKDGGAWDLCLLADDLEIFCDQHQLTGETRDMALKVSYCNVGMVLENEPIWEEVYETYVSDSVANKYWYKGIKKLAEYLDVAEAVAEYLYEAGGLL